MSDTHNFTNRLIDQKSPYLLQHAHNPVDWFPWGEEAFELARSTDRPIFLSVGYATCHWCHVMEKESFEDPKLAKLLNDTFINIKVDREELPEVDNLYMEFAQSMMGGAAGWPLNVFLTPTLQPFFATTYLPPTSRQGLLGLTDLIGQINEAWQSDHRERIKDQAHKVVEVFAEHIHIRGNDLPPKEMILDTAEMFFKMADPIYGGIKGKPKFPIGYQINFMLRYASTNNDSRAVFLVDKTLDMMHRGGIYDHLGGGFSRYSIDEKWEVPHFEKMLYDNALLSSSYLEGWFVTKNPLYKQVCQEIIEYILRDMTHEEGAFFSAEDADSEGREGLFYTWSLKEVQKILGDEESKEFLEFYDMSPRGNFEGRNVLHTSLTEEEFSLEHKINVATLRRQLEEQRRKLWTEREKRVHPLKDDKVLSAWNGLMISALTEAAAAFDEQSYLDAAVKAATFIKQHMWREGCLYRRWREGETAFVGGLDEYAFMIKGCLALFEADQGSHWLEWAIELDDVLKDEFKATDGAYYQTNGADPNLILRKAQFSDGAEPSGNAIQCHNLLKLYQITGNVEYKYFAEDLFCAVKKYLEAYPLGYCYHAMNLNRYYDQHSPTLLIALNDKESHLSKLKKVLFNKLVPHKAIIWRRHSDQKLFKYAPFVKEQGPIDRKTTLYICREGVCQAPLNNWDEIVAEIEKL